MKSKVHYSLKTFQLKKYISTFQFGTHPFHYLSTITTMYYCTIILAQG